MANRPHFISNPATVAVPETGNNTETVVNTLTSITPEIGGQVIKLSFNALIVLGASSVGGTWRIRRSALTGTLVGIAMVMTALATAAGATEASGAQEDTPGEGIFTYVLTYQGTGDTGVASITGSEFTARWD